MQKDQINQARRFVAKNLQIMKGGMEGDVISFTLYVDGVRTATYFDGGDGGQARWHELDKHKFAEFEAFVNALPPWKSEYSEDRYPMNAEVYAGILISRAELGRDIKRQIKTCSPFTMPSDEPGYYRHLRLTVQFDAEQMVKAKAHYPGALFAHEDLDGFLDHVLRHE